MNVHRWGALLVFTVVCYAQQTESAHFSGIAINTTNPDKPVAAQLELSLGSPRCTFTVYPPLSGSGPCKVSAHESSTGKTVIVSDGPPVIVWTGTIKGNLFSGTYDIASLQQKGSFYLAFARTPPAQPNPPAPPAGRIPNPPRSSCSPAIESSIDGDFEGWSGSTIFKLENGQIWQQAEYDYDYEYDFDPDVTIYQTASGCRMKVEGDDETILVKRLK
jgi:hypothetical protein